MKKLSKTGKKILAVVLALVMVAGIIPMSATAAEKLMDSVLPKKEVSFSAISDVHIYPYSLTGDYCDAYMHFAKYSTASEPYESEALLESALAGVAEQAKKNNQKILILPGDLTSNGEYEGHIALAERLEKFEKDTGITVLVINGNHDINKKAAKTFVNGIQEPGRMTDPKEFKEIYKNLGYDVAYHTYIPSKGEANQLSYSARADGYRFLMMDTGKYSSDVTADGTNYGETAGCMTEEFIQWVEKEIKDAEKCGETVIGVSHHNLVPHFKTQATILRGFVLDNWEEITERLADAGLHYSITGHQHINDIAEIVSDNGEKLVEIGCDSLQTFPNYFREMTVSTSASGEVAFTTDSIDIDSALPVTINGKTYPAPFRKESLGLCYFEEGGLVAFAKKVVLGLLEDYGLDFTTADPLEVLASMGLDLEEILSGFFGDGLVIGDKELFTTKNLLSFIDDLLIQITELYLKNPEKTDEYIGKVVEKLLSVKVSDIPNTTFIEEYGFGSYTEPGTFEDVVENLIVYLYDGGYDMTKDAFMMDAVNNLENGTAAFDIFNALIDIAENDLVKKILGDLKLNVDALFPDGSFGECIGDVLQTVISAIFMGNNSYINIADKVLAAANKLGVVDFASLWGIAEHYMNEYLTETQIQAVGYSLAQLVRDFAMDTNITNDKGGTFIYNGPVEVEATQDNYRIPTAVTMSLGADQSSRNVSWYTKTSVLGSDIEIIEQGGMFKGVNAHPSGITINAETEKTTRQYYGVDVGVIGVMDYIFPMNRHTISVSGLVPGKTYLYRVGDASRGWWSEAGSFKAADGSDKTSFLHIGDPQCSAPAQYNTFAGLIEKANKLYDADFIVNTGDSVDHGNNFNQWRWFLDTASSTLMNVPMMAASGNHEELGEYAIEKNFFYSNVPEQDTESGIYFSFDYNNTHFAVLNTNDIDDDNTLGDAQIDWLIDDMKSSDADWKFVVMHKAMYSNGSHYKDKDVCGIRDELCELMPKIGIDMVFQGHDHVYLRTGSMIGNSVETVTTSSTSFGGKDYTVTESPVGVYYVISGCSGVKVYKTKDDSLTDKYFPRAEKITHLSTSCFSGVRIDGDTLYFDAYSYDAETGETEVIDSLAIRKDLSVKKGSEIDTGAPSFSFSAILEVIKTVILPILKNLFDKISAFLSKSVIG